MSIDFLPTSLIVVVSPGTGGLYTLAAGLSSGRFGAQGNEGRPTYVDRN